MTTPSGGPLLIPVGNNPQQVCPPLGKGTSVLLQNLDPTDNLFYGRSSGIGLSNSLLIAAGGSAVVDASRAIWAWTDSLTPPVMLQVDAGTSQYNLSPGQVLSSVNIAALAVAIATAISTSGVSLLAAPTLLYNIPLPVNVPGAALVGATVNKNTYPGDTPVQAAQAYDTAIGSPRIPAVQLQKFYYSEGGWPSGIPSPELDLWNIGCNALISFKPNRTASGTYSDSTITNGGNTCLAEKNNLVAAVNNYLASAMPGQKLYCVLWQEPKAAFTASAYINYVQYYAPAVRALGVQVAYDMNGDIEANQTAYYPGDAVIDLVMCDYYWSAYNNGVTLNTLQGIADAAVPKKPMGLGEYGAQASASPTFPTVAQWTAYTNYLINVFAARLAAGKTNAPVTYFNGYAGGNPANPPTNLISAHPEYIPGIQAVYDALNPKTTSTVIAGGSSLVLTPVNPSPGAGYAVSKGLSYDITIGLIAGAASTTPFALVTVNWFNTDSPTAQPVDTETWALPMGTNGTTGTVITGKGPMRGQFWSITIKNLDTQPCTVSCQANSTGRTAPVVDDLRWDSVNSVAVPGYTAPSGGAFGNSLGSINGVSVPGGGGTIKRLLSMFAGAVSLEYSSAGASQLQFQLNPQPSSYWGTGSIYNITSAQDNRQISLPHAPCQLVINNANAGAVNAFAETIIIER